MRSVILRPTMIDHFGLQNYNQVNVGSLGHRMVHIPEELVTTELIREIAKPFAFVVTTNFNNEYPLLARDISFDHNETNGLVDILKALMKKRFGVEWTGTKILRFSDSVLIYPICDGEYFYLTEAERVKLDTFNIDSLLRKRIISSDPSIFTRINGNFHNAEIVEDLILVDDSIFSYISPREASRRLTRLEFLSMETRRNGVTFITSEDEISEWLLAEICMVWNFRRVSTDNIEYYSQQPQIVLRNKVKQESIKSRRIMESANSKLDQPVIQELEDCPPTLPFEMISDEFKNFLLTSLKSIVSGNAPILRVPGLVGAKRGERDNMQKQLNHNYDLLAKVNPWSKGLKGLVEADLSMSLEVFSPEDLNVLLSGDISNYLKISSIIPGEIMTFSGEKVVKLPDGTVYSIDQSSDLEERWKRGDLLSRWGAFMLASREYTSCIL